MSSEAGEKCVETSFCWPFHISEFQNCKFNKCIYSPVFRIVYNSIGFDWRLKIKPAGGICSKKEYRENIGCYLQLSRTGFRDHVNAKFKLFIEKNGGVAGMKDFSHRFLDFRKLAYGKPTMLPMQLADLRSEGLIEDETLKLCVTIKIPVSEFTWDDILKKEEEELLRGRPKLDFDDMFDDVSVKYKNDNYTLRVAAPDTYEVLNFKIIARDGDISCHKVVLVKKSLYFRGLVTSNMKESKMKEVTFHDLSCKTLEEIVHYMYKEKTSENLPDLDVYELLEGANRLDLPGLKLICHKELIKKLKVENVARMFITGDTYQLRVLREVSLNLAAKNPLVVWESEGCEELSNELWEEVLETSEKLMRTFTMPILCYARE